MAILKGKGAMTGVNLVGKIYDNATTKDGKSVYADFQVDARHPGPAQTNLHLKSDVIEKDGVKNYNNGARYTKEQMAEVLKAAGPNTEPFTDLQGNKVGMIVGVKANVMPASKGSGLVLNTKTVGQSDFKVGPDTLENQITSAKEAKAAQTAARESAKEAEATAPEAAAEAKAEAESPAFG